MSNLNIIPELRDIWGVLTELEKQELESQIIRDGVLSPIIVWEGRNVIVDGHNRYDICTRHNLEFPITKKPFGSLSDAMAFAVEIQRGRRNADDLSVIQASRRVKNQIEKEAKERQVAGLKQGEKYPVSPKSDARDNKRTDEKLAEMSGMGRTKFRQGEYILDNAPEEIVDKVKSKDISVNKAHELTKAYIRADDNVKQVIVEHVKDDKVDHIKTAIKKDEALANFINECHQTLRKHYQELADNARDSLDNELNKPTESEDSE